MSTFSLKRAGAVTLGIASGMCVIVPAPKARAALLTFNSGPPTPSSRPTSRSMTTGRPTSSRPRAFRTTSLAVSWTRPATPRAAAHLSVGAAGTTAVDASAIYTAAPVTLTDGLLHAVSEFAKVTGTPAGGDKYIQLGFISTAANVTGGLGFNNNNKFISVRILGNNASAEIQATSGATGGTASTATNAISAGSIAVGDWVKVILNAQETNTATGAFSGTYSVEDWGQSGTALSSVVIGNKAFSVTVSNIANVNLDAGFRSAIAANAGGTTVSYDNFAVDNTPEPASLGLLGLTGAGLLARRRRQRLGDVR